MVSELNQPDFTEYYIRIKKKFGIEDNFVTLEFTDSFSLSGIALGTILVIVYFHIVNGREGSSTHPTTSALSHKE